jgi:hypothetical protein
VITLVDENLRFLQSGGHIATTGMLSDFTTSSNDYTDVKVLYSLEFYTTKIFTLAAATHSLKVQILGDDTGDWTFAVDEAEFTVVAGAAPTVKDIVGTYFALKLQVKPAVAGLNGVLSTVVCFSDVTNE